MNEPTRVVITKLPTGVPGLDEVLGGGLPEYSFNLIAGTPGAGKTTLAHQIMFTLASADRPALYFTLVGEPLFKMLRYQQQMSFFDPAKVGTSIHFENLSEVVLENDLNAVLEHIIRRVEERSPGLVFVDSFQTVARMAADQDPSRFDLQGFVQRLSISLTSWQATTFLVGEYVDRALLGNPVFTVADGIIWLTQTLERNSVVRKLNALKQRGQAPMPGLHTFRVGTDGIRVFPRATAAATTVREQPASRLTTGVAGLDELLGGGIPAGDTVLVSGASGTGKSVLATQFIAAGVGRSERAVIAVFEPSLRQYVQRAAGMGVDLEAMVRVGALEIVSFRPLDLTPAEIFQQIQEAVVRLGARRLAIDSLTAFGLALTPSYRADYRESLHRLIRSLAGKGTTVLVTMEVVQPSTELRFSPYLISFLADDIVLLRYSERDGQLETSLAVVKMRNSSHNREFWRYEIGERGLVLGESLRGR